MFANKAGMNLLPPKGTLTMRSGAAETIFCGAMLAEARRNTMRNAAVKLIFLTGLIGAVCAGGLALRSVRLHTKEVKAPENPLKLDAATEAIFAHADKVEALRLADFLDSSTRSLPNFDEIAMQKYGLAYNYTLMCPARVVNTNFAPRLRETLRLTPDKSNAFYQCFEPGVGFRVWRGKTHTEVFVCFHCEGVEIVTTNERKKEISNFRTDMGAARKSLLALSREAFPEDKVLQELKDTL